MDKYKMSEQNVIYHIKKIFRIPFSIGFFSALVICELLWNDFHVMCEEQFLIVSSQF